MKPLIVAVDDDPASRELLRRELSGRYDSDYEIVIESDATRVLNLLALQPDRGDNVALILADHWMPELSGPELLLRARLICPRARRGLLIDWAQDRANRRPIMDAVMLGHVDYYLAKPVHAPDERFHRAVTEFLDEWWRTGGRWYEAMRVIGDRHSPRTHEICDLLSRNSVPYGLYDADSDEGRALLEQSGAPQLPVVLLFNGEVLADPTNRDVGAALGAGTSPTRARYDVAIVGGGPAGLAAAVYAGSEGLSTVLVEPEALGGQAGTSSMIRNYLGFPRGISGTELASRATEQANVFGAEVVYGNAAVSLTADGSERVVGLVDGEVRARAVVIATGVSYRRLDIPSLEALIGAGVFYGAAVSEAQTMAGRQAFIVGGGNSAGQAALHLARYAAQVTILVRSESLAESMSRYLIAELDHVPNIDVRYRVEVVGGGGEHHLEHIVLRLGDTDHTETVAADALFVLIGGKPFTDWVGDAVARDQWGYILTGEDAADLQSPSLLATSLPGVFAIGDVRHGSIKRVASAVGEGSICVRLVHDYLAQLDAGSNART